MRVAKSNPGKTGKREMKEVKKKGRRTVEERRKEIPQREHSTRRGNGEIIPKWTDEGKRKTWLGRKHITNSKRKLTI